jgi:signal transduction histidine kinase
LIFNKFINLNFFGSDYISTSLSSCSIDIDVNKMSQVLRNLVSNALKFTPKDGTVTIKAYKIMKVISFSSLKLI